MASDTRARSRELGGHPLLAGSRRVIERAPELQAALDESAMRLTEEFRQAYAAATTKFTVARLDVVPFQQAIAPAAETAVAAIFKTGTSDAAVIMLLERPFVLAFIDTVLGGDGTSSIGTGARLTKIALSLAQAMAQRAAAALQAGFRPFMPLSLSFVRLEEDFDSIRGKRGELVARATLEMTTGSGACGLQVVLPGVVLAELRGGGALSDAEAEAGPEWQRSFGEEIKRADIALRAVIKDTKLTLRDVAALKVGQVLRLEAAASRRIVLESSGQPLFWCQLGRSDGLYTVRLDEPFDPTEQTAQVK